MIRVALGTNDDALSHGAMVIGAAPPFAARSGAFRNAGAAERRFPAPPMISGLLASQPGGVTQARGSIEGEAFGRSGSYYLSLGAESVPGFRLHGETMV